MTKGKDLVCENVLLKEEEKERKTLWEIVGPLVDGTATRDVQKTMRALKTRSTSLQATINEKNEAISRLARHRMNAEKDLDVMHRAHQILTELLFIREGVSRELAKLQKSIESLRKEGDRRDITVARRDEIVAKVKALSDTLKGKCDHRFVFSYDAYRGSYSMDYEDSKYEVRRCMVCGFRDESKQLESSVFDVLNNSDKWLIKRDLRGESYRYRTDFESYDRIRAMLLNSLGSRNADWREDPEPKTKQPFAK